MNKHPFVTWFSDQIKFNENVSISKLMIPQTTSIIASQ